MPCKFSPIHVTKTFSFFTREQCYACSLHVTLSSRLAKTVCSNVVVCSRTLQIALTFRRHTSANNVLYLTDIFSHKISTNTITSVSDHVFVCSTVSRHMMQFKVPLFNAIATTISSSIMTSNLDVVTLYLFPPSGADTHSYILFPIKTKYCASINPIPVTAIRIVYVSEFSSHHGLCLSLSHRKTLQRKKNNLERMMSHDIK